MRWILLFILVVGQLADAADAQVVRGVCATQFRIISASEFPTQPLGEWSFEAMDLFVQPEQLLPRGFLKELQKEGAVTTALRRVTSQNLPGGQTGPALELSIVRGKDTVLSLTIAQDAKQKDRFILSSFEAGNPDMNPYRENYITRQALLPGGVSAHLKKQLFALAKAGGAKTIELAAPSNYLALQRARRDGFRPVAGKSTKTIEALDTLYKLGVKREIVDGPDHFAEALGTQLVLSHDLLMHQTLHKAWAEYKKTGKTEGPVKLYFEDGKLVLFEMEREDAGQGVSWFGIVDPHSAQPQLLEWRQLQAEGRLRMERKLE